MEIFIASRLSNGNALFPVEVHIDDYSVMIKKPGLISGRSKPLMYKKISSVEVISPFIGFSKIKFNTIGFDSMLVEGFERAEAEEIQRLVEIKLR
jgi:hypothetical protein